MMKEAVEKMKSIGLSREINGWTFGFDNLFLYVMNPYM